MTDLGRFLILLGAVAIVAGLALVLLGRTNIPLGRLPGDIHIEGENRSRLSAVHDRSGRRPAVDLLMRQH